MTRTFLVGVRGESFKNEDGTSRQDVIRQLRSGMPVKLVAEPTNPHDRWAVRVETESGQQIGFLPSDARDADALLKGEPISGTVHAIRGGTNWLKRLLGKRHVGVVLRLHKAEPDWDRRTRLQHLARPIDAAVEVALNLEHEGKTEAAVASLRAAVAQIRAFTRDNPYASAHRSNAAPVDRLSLLLERQRRFDEALQVILEWERTFDPVQPGKSVCEVLRKRADRLRQKLAPTA